MKQKLISILSSLGILSLLVFGSKIAKRSYDREVHPKPIYSTNQCVLVDDTEEAMIDKTSHDHYSIKLYKEIVHWSYDYDGVPYYTPYHEVTGDQQYTIKEGNAFFKEIACPSLIKEVTHEQ